jgi:chromosome segregation ATPase
LNNDISGGRVVELEFLLRKAESEVTRMRKTNAELEGKAADSAGHVGNSGEITEMKQVLGREKERGRAAAVLAEQISVGAGDVFEGLSEVIRDVREERKAAASQAKKAQTEVESMAESMNALKDELKVCEAVVDEKNSALQTLQAAFDRQVTGRTSLKPHLKAENSLDTSVPNRAP